MTSDPASIPRATRRLGPPRGAGTASRSYSDDEREFLKAVDRFKRDHDYANPTARDILAIAHALGYRKAPS